MLAIFCPEGNCFGYLGKPDQIRQFDPSHLARVGSVYCVDDQILELVMNN